MAKSDRNKALPDHNYDGIQELDNDLPPWWLWLFYLTIIWSVIYLVHYHVLNTGDSSEVEYLKEINPDWKEGTKKSGFTIEYRSPFYKSGDNLTPLKREELALEKERETAILLAEKKAEEDENISLSDLSFNEIIMAAMDVASQQDLEKLRTSFPEIWDAYQKSDSETGTAAVAPVSSEPVPVIEPLTDEASLASGEAIFSTSCATCHGKLGGGGIGPNFTDDYFLHGHTIKDMITTIKNGVPAKGMISWRPILTDQQILEVASYIQTLRGTNPPNAKAPQGEKVDFSGQ